MKLVVATEVAARQREPCEQEWTVRAARWKKMMKKQRRSLASALLPLSRLCLIHSPSAYRVRIQGEHLPRLCDGRDVRNRLICALSIAVSFCLLAVSFHGFLDTPDPVAI